MMHKIVNGILMEMTPEEIAEWERRKEEESQAPELPPEKTPEERIAELEEALEMLLSGVTKDV